MVLAFGEKERFCLGYTRSYVSSDLLHFKLSFVPSNIVLPSRTWPININACIFSFAANMDPTQTAEEPYRDPRAMKTMGTLTEKDIYGESHIKFIVDDKV